MFRLRAPNNYLQLSFAAKEDFVVAVMAATSANIRIGITSTLEGRKENQKALNSCVLQLDLEHQGRDSRLVFFFYEVLEMKLLDGSVTKDFYESNRDILKKYEHWMDVHNEGL